MFNLTVHKLHELNYDRPTSWGGIGKTRFLFEHVSFSDEKDVLVADVGCAAVRRLVVGV